MLATPSQPAAAHRELARIGVTIGTVEYAYWSKSIRAKTRERTERAIHRR